eukprot:1782324-Prymnesium_polylepis.1
MRRGCVHRIKVPPPRELDSSCSSTICGTCQIRGRTCTAILGGARAAILGGAQLRNEAQFGCHLTGQAPATFGGSSSICGDTCVLLPEPVSPQTSATCQALGAGITT